MDTPSASIARAHEWFNLVRYEVTATLTPDQWTDQVAKRAVINQALLTGDQNSLDQLMPDHIDAPMSDWPFQYRNTDGPNSARCEPVTPLGEMQLARLMASASAVLALDSFVDQRWILNDEQVSMSRFGHIRVDMNASDGDIVVAFSQWLKNYREISTPGTTKSRPSTNLLSESTGWHRRRLLPYFDLVAWSAWSTTHLTEKELLILLFPQIPDAPRELLRTLTRQMDQVFTMSNVLRLQLRSREPDA